MITQSQMPLDMERRLNSELNAGETLLWTGQPDPARMSRQIRNIVVCLFGIPWTIFALGWEFMSLQMAFGLPLFSTPHLNPSVPPMPSSGSSPHMSFGLMGFVFPLFGVPFVLVGLWMLSSPYWTWRKAHKIVYAVTNRRALILEPNWRGGIVLRSVMPDNLADRTRTQNADGSGTLIFNRLTTRQSGGEGGTSVVTVGFEQIPEVKEVDDLIGQTFR